MPTIQKTLRMLDFIKRYQAEHFVAPSMKVLCEEFGLRSSASVHHHIQKMKDKGWIKRGHYARHVEFVEPRKAA